MSERIDPPHAEPDPLDKARGERDAAVAELGHAGDRLADRLLELRDPRALELFDQVLAAIESVVGKSDDAWTTFIESLSGVHDLQLQVLGSNRREAAAKVLAAMNQGKGGGPWPNP